MLGSNSMLLILLFKLFRLWPLASLSDLLLCPLDQPPNLLIFEPFLIFKHYTKLQAHLYFPSSALEQIISLREMQVPLIGEQYQETRSGN